MFTHGPTPSKEAINASQNFQEHVPDDPNKSSEAVHTMPNKFLKPVTPPKPKGLRKKGLVIAIVVVLLIAIVGVSVFLFQQFFKKDDGQVVVTPTLTNNVNQKTNTNMKNANVVNNSNMNALSNSNANSNANLNSNGSANTSNTNRVNNSNTNSKNSNSTTTNTTTKLPSSEDTDSDALTDIEEDLYGTRVNRADSDADGYMDGEEVNNLYDPLGNGKLSQSPQIAIYESSVYDYAFMYPASWPTEIDNSKSLILTSETGEFMEVFVSDNADGLSAKDWYKKQFPDQKVDTLTEVTGQKGLKGVMSIDGSTVYFTDSTLAYGITYKIGAKDEESYSTTFKMLYASFTLDQSVYKNAATNTNASGNMNANNTNTNTKANTNTNKTNTNNSNKNL